jgi:hypothetical protein
MLTNGTPFGSATARVTLNNGTLRVDGTNVTAQLAVGPMTLRGASTLMMNQPTLDSLNARSSAAPYVALLTGSAQSRCGGRERIVIANGAPAVRSNDAGREIVDLLADDFDYSTGTRAAPSGDVGPPLACPEHVEGAGEPSARPSTSEGPTSSCLCLYECGARDWYAEASRAEPSAEARPARAFPAAYAARESTRQRLARVEPSTQDEEIRKGAWLFDTVGPLCAGLGPHTAGGSLCDYVPHSLHAAGRRVHGQQFALWPQTT